MAEEFDLAEYIGAEAMSSYQKTVMDKLLFGERHTLGKQLSRAKSLDDMRGMRVNFTITDEIMDWQPTSRPKPPKFDRPEDADAWMAATVDHSIQNYPVGAHVVWDRTVEQATTPVGLVVPEAEVEFVGKVVKWYAGTVIGAVTPRYQLLTLSWVHQEPELVWVHAEKIKGLA